MGSLRLTVVVVGIFVVSLVSILSPGDDPKTAFDETDTPINIAAPALDRVSNLKLPVEPRTVVRVMFPQHDRPFMTEEKTSPLSAGQSRAPLDLLHALLC
jgi:hypothetical protein